MIEVDRAQEKHAQGLTGELDKCVECEVIGRFSSVPTLVTVM